jgi:hypothetical protein
MGGQWTTQAQYGYPPARRARRWPWVLFAIGIAAGLALEASVIVGVYLAVRQVGRASCLPSDFPQYQGATTTGLNVYNGTNGSRCDMVFDSADSAGQVTDFYTNRLDQGNWRIVSISDANGTIAFQRRSDPGVHGQLQVLGKGVHSSFQVVVQAGG